MQYEILLTKNPGNGYTARPMLWPEMVVTGEEEEQVLAQIRDKLTAVVKNSRVVSVDVNADVESDEPDWMQYVRVLSQIPEDIWQAHLAEIEKNRRILDLQMQDIDETEPTNPCVEEPHIKLEIELNAVYP